MPNPNEPRTGHAYARQVVLTDEATQDGHAVRYNDPAMVALRASGIVGSNNGEIGFVTSGYTPNFFGTKDASTNGHLTVPNGSAVLIGEDGKLATATSVSVNAKNSFALKANDKYYLPGMIAFNFGTSLIPGRAYWLQVAGAPALGTPTQSGEWSVRVGLALTATDMLVVMDVEGQL